MFLTLSSLQANPSMGLDTKQVKELIKENTLYIIDIDEKSLWFENKIKVKNFQSIKKGIIEFKLSTLDLNTYNKDSIFVVSSKKDSLSRKFLKRLKNLGFSKAKYLKNGEKSWREILINFRGLKLFSMFK